MASYPIMLNIRGKEVVVVGGGKIASRKIIGLFQAGACVTVISPKINLKIEKLLAENKITWKNKEFEPVDLHTAMIVIAATDSEKVNQYVASSADKNQLVNVVDKLELSTFHTPAKLTRGDLTISIATGGASPILATAIRDELAVIYDETYEEYLKFLSISRVKVKDSIFSKNTKKKLLKVICSEKYRESYTIQSSFIEMMDGFANNGDSSLIR